MTLSSAINLARLFSIDEVQSILQTALNQMEIDARNNCALYSEIDQAADCPGDKSCSVEEILLGVTTAISEYFHNALWEEFENIEVYAVR
jgi:hypothetical protein